MPELPEVLSRAREMHLALVDKVIAAIQITQPKCLNLTPEQFTAALAEARIFSVSSRGKWIFVDTSRGWLLLNSGMGGEILLRRNDQPPKKWRLAFAFTDGSCLWVNFWWFGYAHYVPADGLHQHQMTRNLGPNAIDVSADQLWKMIAGRKGAIKTFLLDQTQLAGIGNAYIHDILFLARLHPLRKLNTLGREDVERLVQAIQEGLQPSIAKNGAFYEVDLLGRPGGFRAEDIIIGYREGQPCPGCGTAIEKIRTGGTSSFICPNCQPIG